MKSGIKKLIIAGTVGLLGVAGATAAFARHGGGPEHRMRFIEHMVSAKLDLNAEQREKLGAVKQAVIDAKQRNRAERELQHEKFETVLLGDTLDQEVLKEMLAEHQQRLNAELPAVLDAVQELHDSLSQEQKQKAVDALKALKARHGH